MKTLDQFIEDVDKVVQMRIGVSVHDLPDICFCDYYEEDSEYTDKVYKGMVYECATAVIDAANY